MTSIQDIIKKKQAEIAARKAQSLRTIKPAPGKHTYRILPGWKVEADGTRSPEFWHDFGMHWIKSTKDGNPEATYVCVEKTFGGEKSCPICQAIGKGISASKDDALIDVLKANNAGQRYLLNVLHRTAPENDMKAVPQVLEVGAKVFEQVLEYVAEYGDITDLKDGTDLIIKREGSGFDTTYTVLPAAKSVPVKADILEKINNLDAYVNQESKPALTKALTAITSIAGVSVSAVPALTAPVATKALSHDLAFEDDEDIIDVPVEKVIESKPVAADVADDLDDLDSLLADVE